MIAIDSEKCTALVIFASESRGSFVSVSVEVCPLCLTGSVNRVSYSRNIMSIFRRLAISLALGLLGYVIGLFGGMGLVYQLSSNQHDRSIEAAMTGALFTGPLTALLFAAVSFIRSK